MHYSAHKNFNNCCATYPLFSIENGPVIGDATGTRWGHVPAKRQSPRNVPDAGVTKGIKSALMLAPCALELAMFSAQTPPSGGVTGTLWGHRWRAMPPVWQAQRVIRNGVFRLCRASASATGKGSHFPLNLTSGQTGTAVNAPQRRNGFAEENHRYGDCSLSSIS